jgi:hypothetical protein
VRRLILLASLPLLVAACGGTSDASSRTTTAATTPSDYVTAGNKVCIASDKRIFKIGRLSRDPKGWARTAAAARTAVREMRTITPPAERRAAFARMLKFANALALTIQEAQLSLVKNDLDTAAAAQFAAGHLQDQVHTAAKQAGLTFCQQPLTNWPA